MATRTIAGAKFVGTISLGLLTGLAYTTTTLTLPTLLQLPSATTARTAYTRLRSLCSWHTQSLTALTSVSFFLAYALSPPTGRHPYLLWVSLLTGAGSSAIDYVFARGERQYGGEMGLGGVEGIAARAGVGNDEDSEDYDREEEALEQEVNGEQVRGAVERWRWAEGWRSGVVGTAFLMGIVGIWGDKF
ncbi:MAG: hypothetical protein Q9165_000357 [Trypethelium subeluteriae]